MNGLTCNRYLSAGKRLVDINLFMGKKTATIWFLIMGETLTVR